MSSIKTAPIRMDQSKHHQGISNSYAGILKQLVTHRNLFIELSIHDFHAQYLGSVLGFFWSIIKPLALIGVYAVVFASVIAPVTNQQGAPINFGMFLFAGMLPWLAIQESLQRGATVFIDLSHLVRHHAIPLNFLPFTIVLSAAVSQIIAVAAFILIKLVVTQSISYYFLAVIALIPVQIMFCYGLALSVAVLNVFLRDFSHLTTTILFIWFFTSPIVYPLETLPPTMQKCMWINPLTSLIEIYRHPLLYGSFPSITAIFIFIGFSVLFLFVGLFLFNKTNKSIVDWI